MVRMQKFCRRANASFSRELEPGQQKNQQRRCKRRRRRNEKVTHRYRRHRSQPGHVSKSDPLQECRPLAGKYKIQCAKPDRPLISVMAGSHITSSKPNAWSPRDPGLLLPRSNHSVTFRSSRSLPVANSWTRRRCVLDHFDLSCRHWIRSFRRSQPLCWHERQRPPSSQGISSRRMLPRPPVWGNSASFGKR